MPCNYFKDGYFEVELAESVLETVFDVPIRIAGLNDTGGGAGFDGKISCIQIYDEALDLATVHYKKECPDASEQIHTDPCPKGYDYYEGQCYHVSINPKKFSNAEVSCLPDSESKYKFQLLWTENPKILHHFISIINEKTDFDTMFVGLSDKDFDGEFEDR